MEGPGILDLDHRVRHPECVAQGRLYWFPSHVYPCVFYCMYYLMLVRSALRDLWHEGCVQVADTARGEAKCCITPRDHNLSAINHVKHELTNKINGLLLLCGRHRAVR